ncbi:MAG: hypothetical protein WC645_00485 [Candidatus Margulisiibacteriota bacterium]
MSNISPLSGKDAWVKYFQSRGLTQEQAQNAVDTVDLTDGLSQEEATTLGLEAEATIDRYIRQGWSADGEAGVETEEQGVNVMEADELERAYAAIARYADAHNISYEQAQRIYFQSDISFTRQSLSEVKAEREATRTEWVSAYNTKKTENPDLTFVDWAKERFGITDANDPVLANLEAYIGSHADATPEQLVDYLLLNGFAARLTADIQTDPAEGDNPGLGLSQAITGRTAPSDYQVATLEPFYRNAPATETQEPNTHEHETQQAEAAPPSTETTASTGTSGTTEASATLDARRYFETMAALLKEHPGMTLQVGSFRYSWYNGQVAAGDTFGTARAGEEVISLLQESLSVFEGHFTEGDITGALSWINGQYDADAQAHLNLLLTIEGYISSGRQAYAGVEDAGYNDEDYNPANQASQPANPPVTPDTPSAPATAAQTTTIPEVGRDEYTGSLRRLGDLLRDRPDTTLQVGEWTIRWEGDRRHGQVIAENGQGGRLEGDQIRGLLRLVFGADDGSSNVYNVLRGISDNYSRGSAPHLDLGAMVEHYDSAGSFRIAFGSGGTPQAPRVAPPVNPATPAQTETPTERTIYSEQIPSDILAVGEMTTAEQLLFVYALSNDDISAQSKEGETALQTLDRLYPGVSGWTAVLTETNNSIQGYLPADRAGMGLVTLAYELASLSTESEPVAAEIFDEIGENGEESWTFDNSDVPADTPETPPVPTDVPVTAESILAEAGHIRQEVRAREGERNSEVAEMIYLKEQSAGLPSDFAGLSGIQLRLFDLLREEAGTLAQEGDLAGALALYREAVALTLVPANRRSDVEQAIILPLEEQILAASQTPSPPPPAGAQAAPVIAEPSPETPRDITRDVAALRDNPAPALATPVASPEHEIVPEPAVGLTALAAAPAPPPPPANPRARAGETLAQVLQTISGGGSYTIYTAAGELPGGYEQVSIKDILNDADSFLRELDPQVNLESAVRAEYLVRLNQLAAALQTPELEDDQVAVAALQGLKTAYYTASNAEYSAGRGEYDEAIAAYERIENPPAFMEDRITELRGLREAAAAGQQRLADLREQARRDYTALTTYATENNLTDQDLSGNLQLAETSFNDLDSMTTEQEIQNFIDSLPGVRDLGEQVIARREAGELTEATDGAGTESAPPAARGNLGDIPTIQLISANPQVPANRVEMVLQDKWQGIADKFNGVASGIARRNAYEYVAISGYLEFNPSTGRIRWAELEFSSDSGTVSDFATLLGDDANGDGRPDEVGIYDAVANRANALRFTPDTEFTGDSHFQDVGGGWYRYDRRMRAAAAAN